MRVQYIVFLTTVGILFLALCLVFFLFRKEIEGFATEKEPSEHPLSLAQKLLRQSLVPIRKVVKYALDKDMIIERFRQAKKTPMELAREYAKANMKAKTT